MGELKRLIITCGGTGGHFYPGLSIARKFSGSGEVKLLLSGVHGAEQKKIAENFAIKAVALPDMPHPGKSPLRFAVGFAKGFFAAWREFKKCSPQALLGMGSFATLPVILAALFRRIPVFLHDGNARIGAKRCSITSPTAARCSVL